MAKRRKKGELPLGFGLVITAYLAYTEAWIALGFFWLFLLLIWISFFKRTVCDVQNKSDRRPCGNIAYGKLRACHLPEHKRAKRDAMLATLRLRNPGQRYRVMWSRADTSHERTSPVPGETVPKLTRPLYDAAMLVATVASAVAAIVALLVQTKAV